MAMKSITMASTRSARAPRGLAKALNQSVEDLRHGRTVDAAQYQERVQARVDAYFAWSKRGNCDPAT
jgi:hypothetical protein